MLAAELVSGVAAAFPSSARSKSHIAAPSPVNVQTGAASKACGKAADRHTCLETVIGDDLIVLALVVDGQGGDDLANWAHANMLKLVVKMAQGDPSGQSLTRAGWRAFQYAHGEASLEVAASLRSGCTLTVCAVNRTRREVTTCGLGACMAVLLSRGSTLPLTEDHRIDHSLPERQRLRDLGAHVARRRDAKGNEMAPLRLWPSGVACARGLGFLGAGEYISSVPFCRTEEVPASGGDIVICSDGVWNELLLSAVAGLARASPSAASAARSIVEAAATQHKSYYQEEGLPGTPRVYGIPPDDATCVVLRIEKTAGAARNLSYAEARAANKRMAMGPAGAGTAPASVGSSGTVTPAASVHYLDLPGGHCSVGGSPASSSRSDASGSDQTSTKPDFDFAVNIFEDMPPDEHLLAGERTPELARSRRSSDEGSTPIGSVVETTVRLSKVHLMAAPPVLCSREDAKKSKSPIQVIWSLLTGGGK